VGRENFAFSAKSLCQTKVGRVYCIKSDTNNKTTLFLDGIPMLVFVCLC